MLAYPHSRLLGVLVLLMAAFKPKSTIAPNNPQLVENLSEIGHTMQFPHRNPGEPGTSSTSASVFESQPQAGQGHKANVRSSWKDKFKLSCFHLEKFIEAHEGRVNSIRPVSTRVETPSQLSVTRAHRQIKGNVPNSAIEKGDENKGDSHSPRPEVGDEPQGQGLSPESEIGDESKAHSDSLVAETQAEKVLKVREQLQIHEERIKEMRDELKWLLKDLEYLHTVFSKWYPTKVTLIEELRQYPKKHFPRLFEDRMGELGGIGSLISAIESKLEAVGVPDASNSRSSQVENSAQAPKRDEDMLPVPNERSTKLQLGDQDGQGLSVGQGSAQPHVKPRETHVAILSGDLLRLVKEKANIAMIQDLGNLLRRDILTPLAGNEGPQGLRYRLRAQTTYEMVVFQILNYMYKFKLISEVEMRSFFEEAETLQHTWLHLSRIYRQKENGFHAYHAFVPQMSFIAGDWQVAHFGRCLADLQEKEHCYLVHQALRWTIEALVHAIPSEERTPESESITEFFYQDNWFHNFLSTAPSISDSEKKISQMIKENVEKTINLFQNFPHTSTGQSVTPTTKQIEYLMNFYMLHFFKTYGNQDVKTIFQSIPTKELFDMKFNMVTTGLEAHQLCKQRYDYEFIHVYPLDLRKQIPCISTGTKISQLEVARGKKAAEFWAIECPSIELTIHPDKNIQLWRNQEPVKGILDTLKRCSHQVKFRLYNENRNMWLIESEKFVPIDTKGDLERTDELTKHLTKCYNVQYWYVFRLEFTLKELRNIFSSPKGYHEWMPKFHDLNLYSDMCYRRLGWT